jgi:hypothetical protein
MGFEPRKESTMEAVLDFVNRMKKVHKESETALNKAQEEMKQYADLDRREALVYKVGDKVMLMIATDWPSRKLAERQIGPYAVDKILFPNAVLLKRPKNIRISPYINMLCIWPYTKPSIPGQVSEPLPNPLLW